MYSPTVMKAKVTFNCGNEKDAEFDECFYNALARGDGKTQAQKLGPKLLIIPALLTHTTTYQVGPVFMGFTEKVQLSATTTRIIDIASQPQFQYNHNFTGDGLKTIPVPGMLVVLCSENCS
jgi:hypothetical protein